jgi:hypothetical protein
VVAALDDGQMSSEAGAMLLGATDMRHRLIERFAGCFTDYHLVEHRWRGWSSSVCSVLRWATRT